MIKFILVTAILIISTQAQPETISLSKKDYLLLLSSSYIHGFNEFDTSVSTTDKSINITIKYYAKSYQARSRANEYASKLKVGVTNILENYSWANDVDVSTSLQILKYMPYELYNVTHPAPVELNLNDN